MERKKKALEADLVERVRKERTLAQRYYKVKFFGEYFYAFPL